MMALAGQAQAVKGPNPPGNRNAATADCGQKGVLLAADLLWSNSYIISCRYLTEMTKMAVANAGACSKLGDGFSGLFASHAMIAILYGFIVIIMLWAPKVWVLYEDEVAAAGEPGTAAEMGALPPAGGETAKVT